ncbi:hypothetical protein LPB73_13760 [Tardiphaga sp. 37S4]|jgi:hypothetical protein|uniref:hypothetical protein n=1 Tax=Tardiphaga sp. 37S4 TaxID=1404741 RepID=UPI001E2C01BE|nr:hypothetical protein [Tardiphaga sp. 37S4]UFS78373.1 hypothetical protein LPB73_13760 [Tardiphaga sp. 37S4]
MSSLSFRAAAMALVLTLPLGACGFTSPRLTEAWEAHDIGTNMVFNIKRNIFCETIRAIREVNKTPTSFGAAIPPDYGVQLQMTLTIAESSAVTPNLTYNRTLTDGMESGVSIGRNWGIGLSGELSSTATRTDTTYSYWGVANIAGPGKNKKMCDVEDWPIEQNVSSLFVKSDLGIERFLRDHVKAADLLYSSKPRGDKKPEKVDVYSYDLKFVVVSSGGVSPQFKLIPLSGGGTPILNVNRTRTHELLLTFGPTGPNGFTPSDISFSQHLTNQLNSSLGRRRLVP